MARKNGRRRLIGCENSVKSEENGLGWYIKNNLEPLLVVVRISGTTTDKKQFTLKNSRKLKKSKEKMNGLQKQCMESLLEIWKTRMQTTHKDG